MIDEQKVQAWKLSMEGFVVSDIRFAVENDKLETGLIILTCAGVDCLGGYYAGQPSYRDTYKAFVREFFPQEYDPHIDALWELRNKLMHDHRIFPYFFVTRFPHEAVNHLKPCQLEGKDRTWFNRHAFAIDFLSAWESYSNRVSNDLNTFLNMEARSAAFDYPYPKVYDGD